MVLKNFNVKMVCSTDRRVFFVARRRPSGGGRIHRLQCVLNRLPIQTPVQSSPKIVGWRSDHQTVQQPPLCVGRREHVGRTLILETKFHDFCRGLYIWGVWFANEEGCKKQSGGRTPEKLKVSNEKE
jgi:hypothetical protein